MKSKLQRPQMKLANTKVSEKDMIYFSLGMDFEDFILPSARNDYRSDARAVQVIKDIQAGKNLSGQDFSGINFKGADLSGGDFTGSSFQGAVFYQTTAKNCNFSGCNFSEAYLEDCDFSDSCFTGCDFSKTFLRHLNTDNAQLDEDLQKRLTAMEFLIHQLETGAIEIHCLTRSELMCLDLRRLDMSKVDVTDIDLSIFNLEGVNLCGVYINPLQKLSLEHWQKDLLMIQKLDEKKLKEETVRLSKKRYAEIKDYAKKQKELNEIKTPSKKLLRPVVKKDEFYRPKSSLKKKVSDDTENLNPKKIDKQSKKIIKGKKLKNRG